MNEDINNLIETAAGDKRASIDKYIDGIIAKAESDIPNIKTEQQAYEWRASNIGDSSSLKQIIDIIPSLDSIELKKAVGKRANVAKNWVQSNFSSIITNLQNKKIQAAGQKEAIDITLPGRPVSVGRRHIISETIEEICDIFVSLGFTVREGPDAEWDYYNFEALNIPAEHPSRDNMSSYLIDAPAGDKGRQIMRTHGTAVSARIIETMKPPIRTIEPARVYRYEALDARHLNIYHNIDGLAVDKNITMGDLKGVLFELVRRYFGKDRQVRFRTDFFPFVEPGAEIAVDCAICHGSGCRTCGSAGWLELGGCGMTHPDVLRRGSIDPEEYSSFAFGLGLERFPMMRYGIDVIRLFYDNDLRFLRQF